MSEINDTKKLTEGIFPINLKTINNYQRKDPRLKAKYEVGKYQKGSFRGGSNIHLNLIMCKGKSCYSANTPKLRITSVPYVSPSSKIGYNRGNNFPTFVLAWYYRRRPQVSK